MLDIDRSKICFIIVKAREFDVKVDPVDLNPGSNAADDREADVLEDFPDDMTYQELRDCLVALNTDETRDLIALLWIGRGDFAGSDWSLAREEAEPLANAKAPDYLLGNPILADLLAEGLNAVGISIMSEELKHL